MLDILKYLVEKGQIKSERDAGSEYVQTKQCPWCGGSKLDVYYKTASFVCRKAKCAQAGKFEKYLMQVEGITWKEAHYKLNGKKRFTSEKLFEFGNRWKPDENGPVDWLKPISYPRHYEEISQKHIDAINYLKGRGVSLEMAKDADMMVSEVERRVIFPVEFGEELVGYIARDYTNGQEKKVLNSRGKFRRMMMYNYMRVHKIRPKKLIVLESAFNAQKCGLDRSVGILGVVMTPEQVNLIKEIKPEELFIFLDPGYEADAVKIAENFRYLDNTKVYIVVMPVVRKANGDVMDAGDLSPQDADRVIQKYSVLLDDYLENKKNSKSLFGSS